MFDRQLFVGDNVKLGRDMGHRACGVADKDRWGCATRWYGRKLSQDLCRVAGAEARTATKLITHEHRLLRRACISELQSQASSRANTGAGETLERLA